MKKWMIITIIIIYSFLIGLIVYYINENSIRKNKLTTKIDELKPLLTEYYNNSYDNEDIGKIFVFPGETNIKFNDDGIVSGGAFIYQNGNIEIALYDGKYCAYYNKTLEITKTKIEECVVNR